MKKYRLTSNTIKYKGKILYQIEALITIYPYDDEEDNLWDPPITNIGELGGYVESESNLSHDGKAWIKDNAKVFGNSRVLDNATVSGRAIVCDNAMILDNATISENAVVCEDATVENNSSVYGDAIVSGTSTICGNSYILDKSKICDSSIENSIIFDDFLKLNLTAYKTEDNVYIATESYPNHVRILESNDFLNFLYKFGKRILGKKFEVKNQNIIDILNNINSILKVSSDIEDKITFDFLMTVFLSFRELLEDKIYR